MKKEKIAMPDGRYLIYYTFDDELQAPTPATAEAATPPNTPEKTDV